MAASSGFLLGLDYSEWADPTTRQIATDASGNLYILFLCTNSNLSCVTKVSGDGKTILWQNALGFAAGAMAVDPRGGVYVTPFVTDAQPLNPFVEKLSADGAGVATSGVAAAGAGATAGAGAAVVVGAAVAGAGVPWSCRFAQVCEPASRTACVPSAVK